MTTIQSILLPVGGPDCREEGREVRRPIMGPTMVQVRKDGCSLLDGSRHGGVPHTFGAALRGHAGGLGVGAGIRIPTFWSKQ